jgi:hypothetical protein
VATTPNGDETDAFTRMVKALVKLIHQTGCGKLVVDEPNAAAFLKTLLERADCHVNVRITAADESREAMLHAAARMLERSDRVARLIRIGETQLKKWLLTRRDHLSDEDRQALDDYMAKYGFQGLELQ